MEAALAYIERIGKWMQAVSGIALTCLMFLTTADVIGRSFGHPIIGTYELVGLGGALVLGFAMPITSWVRGHIFVESLYERWPKPVQKVVHVATRLVSIALFVLIGWNLYLLGADLHAAREVTLTRHIPFYPVAYGLAFCCFVQALVLVCEIVRVTGGLDE